MPNDIDSNFHALLGQTCFMNHLWRRCRSLFLQTFFQTLQKSLTEPNHLLKADIEAIINPIVRINDLLSSEPSCGTPQHNLAQAIFGVFRVPNLTLPLFLHKFVPHVDKVLTVLLIHSKYPVKALKVCGSHSACNMLILCNAICTQRFHGSRIGWTTCVIGGGTGGINVGYEWMWLCQGFKYSFSHRRTAYVA